MIIFCRSTLLAMVLLYCKWEWKILLKHDKLVSAAILAFTNGGSDDGGDAGDGAWC